MRSSILYFTMLTCIGVPNFHAAVRLRRHPSLRPERVVLVDEGLRPPRVVASGQAALAAGVKPGMTVRRAQALCPSAVCLSHDREEAADAFQGIVSVLEMFSPGVEATEPGLAFLDAGPWQGLQMTLEEGNAILAALTLRTGFRAGIGTGQSRFVASIAAEEAGPGRVLVVGPGDEKRFLGPLSVALLPVEGKTLRRLDLLGLRTLGQVRSILREDLIHQFGKEGRLMADLASGIDSTPLSVRREPEPLTASLDFDGPVERGDALLGAALQLLEKLFARLRKRYQLCTRVVLRLHLDDGSTVPITANLATPVGEPELALKALRSRFSTLLLTRPAVGIEVHLEGLGPEQGQQHALWEEGKGQRKIGLDKAVEQLRLRQGKPVVGTIVWDDADSRIPERRAHLEELGG